MTKFDKKILIILLTAFFVMGLLFGKAYFFDLKPNKEKREKPITQEFLKKHRLTISDVQKIKTWMTFDYLNRVFVLPNNYLLDTLQIKDERYPDLTLIRYTQQKKINETTFLNQTKNAVNDYLKLHP